MKILNLLSTVRNYFTRNTKAKSKNDVAEIKPICE